MYIGLKPQVGQFKACVNHYGQIYYSWEEKGYCLFTPSLEFHDGDFQNNSSGDLALFENGKSTKIGYWFTQLDNTVFVCNTVEKIGFVLIKNKENSKIGDVYWATVISPPDVNSLDKLALDAQRNEIINNPPVS